MKNKITQRILIYMAATFIVLYSVLPIAWVVLTSFKTDNEIFEYPPQVLPDSLNLEHYRETIFETDYRFYAQNSLIVGFMATGLVMVFAVMSAYAYSKFFSFRGKNPLMIFVIIARMVPEIAIVIPLFFLLQAYNLYDTKMGLVLVNSAMAFPLAAWLLKTFFDDVPESIVEAAVIDGCTSRGVLLRIILPISGPAIASTFTITFLTVWNTFLIPLVFSKTTSSKTLPVAISELAYGEYGVNWGGLSAVAVIAVLPVFVIGLFAQKYLVTGLTAGAEKS